MDRKGINQGSSGNVSVRTEEGILITPSAVSYASMQPQDIVFMNFDGQFDGEQKPSSEWRMHRDIYRTRRNAGAVVHAHSTYCTVLSCHRKNIPPFHYMIAVAGGSDIRCSDYALFGSQELSDSMLTALNDRRACLLGTHGMICFHDDLERALWLAVEVETLARQYWHALQIGEPQLLTEKEVNEVVGHFKQYGN